jgi:hypothetical protein
MVYSVKISFFSSYNKKTKGTNTITKQITPSNAKIVGSAILVSRCQYSWLLWFNIFVLYYSSKTKLEIYLTTHVTSSLFHLENTGQLACYNYVLEIYTYIIWNHTNILFYYFIIYDIYSV